MLSWMPTRYEFFDHTADIGVHVYGETLEELFGNAAAAMYEALGKFERGTHGEPKLLRLRADSTEDLLHDWLTELLYDLDTQHMYYDQIEFTEVTPLSLAVRLSGAVVDFARSQTNEEIKAVTYHELRVEQIRDGTWRATVILDV